MEIVLFWIALSIVVAYYASTKGHSAFLALLMSLLLSPVIWLIVEAIRSPNLKQTEARAISEGEMKKCPACAELIRREAVKCRYCGEAA